jgi:hypothetical protein
MSITKIGLPKLTTGHKNDEMTNVSRQPASLLMNIAAQAQQQTKSECCLLFLS